MRIMLAPDSFKGSLSAAQAAAAMARGVAAADPAIEVDVCPIADGGEGFVEALASATGGVLRHERVEGPRGRPIDAAWAMLPDGTAVVETAAASGLTLLPVEQRDPARTSTFGTGQLIAAALDAGCQRLIVGLGGSATNDGGTGLAQALGVRFLDTHGRTIDTRMCGGMLGRVASIDMTRLHRRVGQTPVTLASDVTNPLTGPRGASHIYGPQKGATPEQVETLDRDLRHLAEVMRQQLRMDVEATPGAGAAGGLGAGLLAFCGATMASGIELVLDTVGFARRVARCDLCLTGEGRLDGQSLAGKAILGVAKAALRHDVPTIALVGSAADDADATLDHGLAAYRVISAGHDTPYAMRHAAPLLAAAATAVLHERLTGRA